MRISVIIPCYNEEHTIAKVIKAITLDDAEIIVVDNNSTDHTAERASAAGARVVHEPSRGYGRALKTGFRHATGDIIVTLDGDGQYPADAIPKALQECEDRGLDFLSCNRFPLDNTRAMPFVRIAGNWFLTALIRLLFHVRLDDSQSGMWVFHRTVLDRITLSDDDMALSEEIKLRVLTTPSLRFGEYHIAYHPRVSVSKLSVLKHGIKNLIFLIRFFFTRQNIRTPQSTEQNFGNTVAWTMFMLIVATSLAFSLPTINTPFMRVSEDTNGYQGVAAWNMARFGPAALKLGITTHWIENPQEATFYTHHPAGFLWPVAISYALFGVSEASTRAAPLALTILAMILFFAALRRVFRNDSAALLVLGIFAILPGTVYYGKHFDVQQIALPLSLISWSLFVLHTQTRNKRFFTSFLASLVIGLLTSWFYYFFALSLFLVLLIKKQRSVLPEYKKYLFMLPSFIVLGFLLNVLHIFFLGGTEALIDLYNAYLTRSSRIPFMLWFTRSWTMASLMFTPVFLGLAGLGVFALGGLYRRAEWLWFAAPLLLSPLLIVSVFFDWSTHPFGLMFFLPAIALLGALPLMAIARLPRKISLPLIGIVVFAGFLSASQNVNRYNNWLIVGSQDVALFQALHTNGEKTICLGRENDGIPYHGIIEWYAQSRVLDEAECFEKNAKIALVHNPKLGSFYQQKVAFFTGHRFALVGCAERFCLMERTVLSSQERK